MKREREGTRKKKKQNDIKTYRKALTILPDGWWMKHTGIEIDDKEGEREDIEQKIEYTCTYTFKSSITLWNQ